jgi:hypothetical protein
MSGICWQYGRGPICALLQKLIIYVRITVVPYTGVPILSDQGFTRRCSRNQVCKAQWAATLLIPLRRELVHSVLESGGRITRQCRPAEVTYLDDHLLFDNGIAT